MVDGKGADENHIAGKDVPPFFLGKVKELTGGKNLQSNIELVRIMRLLEQN